MAGTGEKIVDIHTRTPLQSVDFLIGSYPRAGKDAIIQRIDK